jgi:hypothetical protein
MSSLRNVPISLPEAKLYLDLSGIASDLREVQKLCARFLEKHAASMEPDWDDLEVLCIAAIIRYGRTFGTGVRGAVPPLMVSDLDDADQIAHPFFKNLRDKWVAHSVNSFECNQLIVRLAPMKASGPGVVDVVVQETRVTSLGPQDMARLKLLATNLLAIVERRIAVERVQVTATVRAMDLCSLYALPDALPPELPGNHVAGKQRKPQRPTIP